MNVNNSYTRSSSEQRALPKRQLSFYFFSPLPPPTLSLSLLFFSLSRDTAFASPWTSCPSLTVKPKCLCSVIPHRSIAHVSLHLWVTHHPRFLRMYVSIRYCDVGAASNRARTIPRSRQNELICESGRSPFLSLVRARARIGLMYVF